MICCPACAQRYPFDARACPKCGFSPQTIAGFDAWAPEVAHGGAGFKSEYFNPLADLEAGNFWFRARNDLLIWACRKYFPDFRSFLEVGCGTGFVLSGLAKQFPLAKFIGSEVFSDGLPFAAQRLPAGRFVQMDARRIPYENEFDVLGAFDVLEHIPEDDTVLAEMYRAVKPGGGLLLTVPQHQSLWSAADDYACHVRRYSAGELHLKVGNAGFQIIRSTSFVTLLLPAMWISRRRSKRMEAFDATAELRLPGLVNAAFESILGFERTLITAGLTLPVGGSRLVVARKPPSNT